VDLCLGWASAFKSSLFPDILASFETR
jgi:hypothetical protein